MEAGLLPLSASPYLSRKDSHSVLLRTPGSLSQHQPLCSPASLARHFLCSVVRLEMETRRNEGRSRVGGRERGTDRSGADAHRPLKMFN